MMPRAVATQTGVALTLLDYLPLSGTATANAQGNAVLTFDAVEPGELWRVEAMSVRTAASPAPPATVRAQVWAGPRLMDGSDRGSFDFSDRSAPILVNSGEQLSVQWSGVPAGTLCSFSGQYQLYARGA